MEDRVQRPRRGIELEDRRRQHVHAVDVHLDVGEVAAVDLHEERRTEDEILRCVRGCNLGRPDDALAPLFIGLTVTLVISVIAPLTQAGINPARD